MGRTYLYGLGAAGEAGVEKALTMLTSEMTRTMQLLGAQRVSDISRNSVTHIRQS
jgi:L-lactate dehydrogenase (cytochrome)